MSHTLPESSHCYCTFSWASPIVRPGLSGNFRCPDLTLVQAGRQALQCGSEHTGLSSASGVGVGLNLASYLCPAAPALYSPAPAGSVRAVFPWTDFDGTAVHSVPAKWPHRSKSGDPVVKGSSSFILQTKLRIKQS